MLTFIDGPAAGVANGLCIRRAPIFLRIVRSSKGEWDALDMIHDTPQVDETIFAYRKVEDHGPVHLQMTRKGRRVSGYFHHASYRLCDPQPDEAMMRSNMRWAAWANEQHQRDLSQTKES